MGSLAMCSACVLFMLHPMRAQSPQNLLMDSPAAAVAVASQSGRMDSPCRYPQLEVVGSSSGATATAGEHTAYIDNSLYPYKESTVSMHFEVVFPIMQYLLRTQNVTR
jgi:hypothetical protein